jgi:hypothetical protein
MLRLEIFPIKSAASERKFKLSSDLTESPMAKKENFRHLVFTLPVRSSIYCTVPFTVYECVKHVITKEKNAILFITNLPYKAQTEPLLEDLNILLITSLNQMSKFQFIQQYTPLTKKNLNLSYY